LEISKTVIVASRWFLYYLTYIDDARSNTNQVSDRFLKNTQNMKFHENLSSRAKLFHADRWTDMMNLLFFLQFCECM